jgi:DNA-binding NtrC family response regulator
VERFAIMPDLDPSIWFQPDGASSDASAASQPTIDLDTGFHEAKREFVERFERRYLSQLVEDRGANASEAARSVGLSRQSYYRLLSKYGLDRD